MTSSYRRRLLILGIDSLDLHLLNKFAQHENLPCFSRLLTSGVVGQLQSIIPPFTIPAWPAMFTGLGPGKLGFASFLKPAPDHKLIPFYSGVAAGHFVWDIVGNADRRVIIMNVPGTDPVYPVNGVMLPSLFANPEKLQCYPPDLGIQMSFSPVEAAITNRGKIKSAYRNFAEWRRLFWEFLPHEWDLFVFVVRITDLILHFTARDNVIADVYKQVDMFLLEVLDQCDRHGWNLLVVSDHGAAWENWRFYINTFLADQGYLTFGSNREKGLMTIAGLITSMGLKPYLVSVLRGIRKLTGFRILQEEAGLLSNLDLSNTQAFAATVTPSSYMGIWLNTREYFVNGHDMDKNRLMEDITAKLLEVKNPADGKTVIEQVWTREELYGDEADKSLPNLVVKARQGYCVDFRPSSHTFLPSHQFMHDLYGTLVAYGPDVRQGASLEGANLVDVAPTVLHWLGLPVPQSVDGRGLKELFRADSEAALRDVCVQDTATQAQAGNEPLSEVDQRAIEERLRALGYI